MIRTILLIGGYGVFGCKLTRLLAATGKYNIILGGRHPDKADDFIKEIKLEYKDLSLKAVKFDLSKVLVAQLTEIYPWAVINLAGPFQGMDYGLARAAAKFSIHYLDIADDRKFVTGIKELDGLAQKSKISIISGASSVPALSSAVVDHLTEGWRQIEKIDFGISPANKTPRGEAVVGAILSYSGQKVKIFKGGRWQELYGWGGLMSKSLPVMEKASKGIFIEGMGKRYFSICDIPDLELFVDHYKIKDRVVFYGGMQISILHLGLSFLSRFVKIGFVKNLSKYTGFFTKFARIFERFGTDTGGMFLEVSGVDAEGVKKSLQWRLIAGKGDDTAGDGINVPIIALFLMIEKLGNYKVKTGARPCLSLLKLQEFEEVFKQFNIECFTDELGSHAALFPRELGPNYQKLPQIIKDMHDVQDEVKAAGKAEIHRGKNIFADMAGWCFRLPPSGSDVPVKVCFKKEGDGEILNRNFDGKVFSSAFTPAQGDGMITEKFGPFKFLLYLDCHEKGIDFNLKKIWAFGWLPVPLFLGPRITAHERAKGPIYHFDVEITLPIIGRIIHYRGRLKIMKTREHILQGPE